MPRFDEGRAAVIPVILTDRVALLCGDSRLIDLGEGAVDAVVTDPPYELGFMGKKWDGTGIAFDPEFWRVILRALKPGGHLLAFGGTRTYHRMACAIEDAGFEVRDSLHWFYGSGFPKSLNVSKAIDERLGAERPVVGPNPTWREAKRSNAIFEPVRGGGAEVITAAGSPEAAAWAGWGTALKPAHEPIILARKPLDGTVAEQVLATGTGALNVDGCRIASEGEEFRAPQSDPAKRAGTGMFGFDEYTAAEKMKAAQRESTERLATMGRWPANVLLDENAAAELDAQTGVSKSPPADRPVRRFGARASDGWGLAEYSEGRAYGDEGGASRFFLTTGVTLCRSCAFVRDAVRNSRLIGNAVAFAESPVPVLSTTSRCDKSTTAPTVSKVARSTNATPIESGPSGASDTLPTQNTGEKSSLELRPINTSPIDLASPAVRRPTDTTRITDDPATCDFCVARVISASTSENLDPGGLDCESPFRYVAKPSGKERDFGCEGLPERTGGEATDRVDGSAGLESPRAGAGRKGGRKNYHPTVKPIELMRWLCRLVTPPGGVVLDPFAGSGTTGIAVLREKFSFVGVEQSEEYVQIARVRISKAMGEP